MLLRVEIPVVSNSMSQNAACLLKVLLLDSDENHELAKYSSAEFILDFGKHEFSLSDILWHLTPHGAFEVLNRPEIEVTPPSQRTRTGHCCPAREDTHKLRSSPCRLAQGQIQNYISLQARGSFWRNAPALCFPAAFTLDLSEGSYGGAGIRNMGSSLTRPLDSLDPSKLPVPREGSRSTNPAAPDASEVPLSPVQTPLLLKSCWSCRLLSGFGLIGAGAYVYLVARRPLKLGYAPGPGTIAKMTIGICIGCWGIIILTDPKGKGYRVA
ncbi:distal membrane-arm assembly complex protein 1 [Cavia porcellus]